MANDYKRAPNPVWIFRDLTGNPLDDTYYAHFLTNTLPYIPQPPYDGKDFATANPWTGGVVQFLANGALPNNLYFNPDDTYRIEIRQGNTQSDPLIYEINNFSLEDSGGDNPDDVTIGDANIITNPQFALVNFEGSVDLTGTSSTSFDIAPGWSIDITASGSFTIPVSRTTLTADQNVPGQAPYYITIDASSVGNVSSVSLVQRFNNNGALFFTWDEDFPRYLSNYIAMKKTGAGADTSVSSVLASSNDNSDQAILKSEVVTNQWNFISNVSNVLPTSDNQDSNDSAWVEYRINIPLGQSVDVTSIQLVSQTNDIQPLFHQEPVERQIDHTWHYYRDAIIQMPKDDVLTGWDFGLNPWQNKTTSLSAVGARTAYTADQTIIHQQSSSTEVNVGRASVANNYALSVQANAAASRFALIQYIAPQTMRDIWGRNVSLLVRARISTSNGTTPKFKARLIRRTSLPSTLSASEPIASWSGTDAPALASGWSYVNANNDPSYTLEGSTVNFTFDRFELAAASNANETLGVIIWMVDSITNAGTADQVLFSRISLVPNDFAMDANVLTFDETLRRCEFYYEKSYNTDVLPGTTTSNGEKFQQIPITHDGGAFTRDRLRRHAFSLDFRTYKRANPTMTFYAPTASTANRVLLQINRGSSQPAASSGSNPALVNISTYTQHQISTKRVSYYSNDTTVVISVSASDPDEGLMRFHYVANARLGK